MKSRHLKILGFLLLSCLLIFAMTACSRDTTIIGSPSSEEESYSLTIEIRELPEGEEDSLKVKVEDDNEPIIIDEFQRERGMLKTEVTGVRGEVEISVIHDLYEFTYGGTRSVSLSSSSNNSITFYVDDNAEPGAIVNIDSRYLFEAQTGVYQLQLSSKAYLDEAEKIGILTDNGTVHSIQKLDRPFYTVAKRDVEKELDLAFIDNNQRIIARGSVLLDSEEEIINLERVDEELNQSAQVQANNISAQGVDEYLAKYEIRADGSSGSVDSETDSLLLNDQSVGLPTEYIIINHIAIELGYFFASEADEFYQIFNHEAEKVGYQMEQLNLYVKTQGVLYDGQTGQESTEDEEEVIFGITEVISNQEDYDSETKSGSKRASLRISYSYSENGSGEAEAMYTYNVTVEGVSGVPGARTFTILDSGNDRTPFGVEITRLSERSTITVYILGDTPDELYGEGTSGNPYLIYEAEELDEVVRHYVNEDGSRVHFKQKADISLEDFDNWRPIGSSFNKFNGVYNGNGFVISDLTIDRPDESSVGLFGHLDIYSRIRKVNLENANVTGNTYVGALAGRNNGTIAESRAEGEVTGNDEFIGGLVGANLYNGFIDEGDFVGSVSGVHNHVGGLVGANDRGEIASSSAVADVEGLNRVGGLVGLNDDGGRVVIGSSAAGTVTGISDVGGLIGLNRESFISTTRSTSEVTGERDNIGSLVGRNFSAAIEDSEATGDATGRNSVGGLVGLNLNPPASAGALASFSSQSLTESISALNLGDLNAGDIVSSEAWGNVHGTDRNIGGLVGLTQENTLIKDSSSHGMVSGDRSRIGGLIGRSDGTIENSYYMYADQPQTDQNNRVTGESQVGRLIGFNAGSFDAASTGNTEQADITFIGQFDNLHFGDVDYQRLILQEDELEIVFRDFSFGDDLIFSGDLNITVVTNHQDEPVFPTEEQPLVYFDQGTGDLTLRLNQTRDHTLTAVVTDNRIYQTDEIKVVDGSIEILDPIAEDAESISFNVELSNLNEAKVRLYTPNRRFLDEFEVEDGETYEITHQEADIELDEDEKGISRYLSTGTQITAILFTDHELVGVERTEDTLDIAGDTTLIGLATPAADLESGSEPLSTNIINLVQDDYEYLVSNEAEPPAYELGESWEDGIEVNNVSRIDNIDLSNHMGDDIYIHLRFQEGPSQARTLAVGRNDIGAAALSQIPSVEANPNQYEQVLLEVDTLALAGDLIINAEPGVGTARPHLDYDLDDYLSGRGHEELGMSGGYKLGYPDNFGTYYLVEVDGDEIIGFGSIEITRGDYSVPELSIENNTIEPGDGAKTVVLNLDNIEPDDHEEWYISYGDQEHDIPAWHRHLVQIEGDIDTSLTSYSSGAEIDDIELGDWLNIYSFTTVGQDEDDDVEEPVIAFYKARIADDQITVDHLSETPSFESSLEESNSTRVTFTTSALSGNTLHMREDPGQNLDRPTMGQTFDGSDYRQLTNGMELEDLELGEYSIVEVDGDEIVGFDTVIISETEISVEKLDDDDDVDIESGAGAESAKITSATEPTGHNNWYVEVSPTDEDLPHQGKYVDGDTGAEPYTIDDDIEESVEVGDYIILYSVDDEGKIIAFYSEQLEPAQVSVIELEPVDIIAGRAEDTTRIHDGNTDGPYSGNQAGEGAGHDHYRVEIATGEIGEFPSFADDGPANNEYVLYDDIDGSYGVNVEAGNYLRLYSMNEDDKIVGFYEEQLVESMILGDVDAGHSSVEAVDDPAEADLDQPITVEITLRDSNENWIADAVESDVESDFVFTHTGDGTITADGFDDSDARNGKYRFEIRNDTVETITLTVTAKTVEITQTVELTWN